MYKQTGPAGLAGGNQKARPPILNPQTLEIDYSPAQRTAGVMRRPNAQPTGWPTRSQSHPLVQAEERFELHAFSGRAAGGQLRQGYGLRPTLDSRNRNGKRSRSLREASVDYWP